MSFIHDTQIMKKLIFLLVGMFALFSCSEISEPADADHEDLVGKQSLIVTLDEARMDLESLLYALDAGTTRDNLYSKRRIQTSYSIKVN